MFSPIADARARSRFSSNDALARGLIEAEPHLDWPGPRSLGAKIGELDLGRPGWWQKRHEHAQALAALLKLPLIDLGLHSEAAKDVHGFTRFPELPPLKLRTERPCEIAAAYKLGADAGREALEEASHDLALWFEPDSPAAQRPAREVHWLCVPPGTGLNLLWEWLETRIHTECMRVETLSQCSTRLRSARPFAVRIDRESGRDVQELARRHPNLAVLVVAPFPAPQRPQGEKGTTFLSWEYFESDQVGRQELSMQDPGETHGGILRYEWRLHVDWRDRLLAWVEHRITGATNDTLFSAAGVARWLAQFGDELGALGPADLMAICRICHSVAESALPRPEVPDAGARLLRHATNSHPHRAEQFSRMVRACLTDRRLPWGEPLPAETWLQFLGTTAGSQPGWDDLQAIADAPTKAERRRLAGDLKAKTENGSLTGLQTDRLLVQGSGNLWCLAPSFIADLLARDHIRELLAQSEVAGWASLCFDPRRQRLVDAALRVSALDTLHKLQDRVLELPPEHPHAIAAGEALFFAIGNQAARGVSVPEALHAIAERVIPGSCRNQWSGPAFWTRPCDTREDAAEQLVVLWTWSLISKPVQWEIPAHWAWHFPGWVDEFTDCFCLEPPFTNADPYAPAVHKLLLDVAARLAGIVKSPEGAPKFLMPLLLARALREGTAVEARWLEAIVGDRNLEAGLLTHIGGPAAAAAVLPAFLDAAKRVGETARQRVYYQYGRIRRWLLSNLSASQADQILSEQQRDLLWAQPRMLPPHLRTWILEKAEPGKHDEIVRDTIGFAGPGDLSALQRWLDVPWIGPQAAHRMWAVAPAATAKVMATLGEGDTSAKGQLVMSCGPGQVQLAIDMLRQEPHLLEPELVAQWAQERMGRAGPFAEELLALTFRPVELRPHGT